MPDGSWSKRQCRRIHITDPAPGVSLRWTETQEEEKSPPVQQPQPTDSGKKHSVTDCGYAGSSHSDGEQRNFSSEDEDGEDAGKAPYTSVGRQVLLNTSDDEDDNEGWVNPRKQVPFSKGDGGAASAGGTGGAAHEDVDGDKGKKEDDEYEGPVVSDDEANPYGGYPSSFFDEEWRQQLEKEEDGTAENCKEDAAEAQRHEETKSESEVQDDDATAKKAAGAAEDISDFPQRQEHVAPEDAAEAGASDAANGAVSRQIRGTCPCCKKPVYDDQLRASYFRGKTKVYEHQTCKTGKTILVCTHPKCGQQIEVANLIQTKNGPRHVGCVHL